MKKRLLPIFFLLASCSLAPEYKKPVTEPVENFKSHGIDWKISSPKDDQDKGQWWKIFGDSKLNELEQKLNKQNHNIKAAASQYKMAEEMASQSRLSYIPGVSLTHSVSKQHERGLATSNSHSLSVQSSWEPDIWGNIADTIKNADISADISIANLAATRLSSQSSLAQYYFQLIMVAKDQHILDKICHANEAIVSYTRNRYKSGVAGYQELMIAEQQHNNAKSAAENNKINYQNFQNAIAILIGEVPSKFNLKIDYNQNFPNITPPIIIPSEMLERRPDVAKSERAVASANAQIGIARSSFFPIFSISKSQSFGGPTISNLLNLPLSAWNKTASLALNVTKLTAYKAENAYALENLNSSLETYRNTVLTAYGDVENNLSSFSSYQSQQEILNIAVTNAKKNLDITLAQYKAGIIDQSELSTAEITYFTALKTFNNLEALKATTTVTLITSLGGGWE